MRMKPTAHHWQGIKFVRQQINTSANTEWFSIFPILCLVLASTVRSFTLCVIWFGASKLKNYTLFFSLSIRSGAFRFGFALLCSFWLAVPLTQNFLANTQLDSDSSVTASMASHLGRRRNCFTGLFPWASKEKHLPSSHYVCVCVYAEIARIRCSFIFFNVVDSLETVQIDYVSEWV